MTTSKPGPRGRKGGSQPPAGAGAGKGRSGPAVRSRGGTRPSFERGPAASGGDRPHRGPEKPARKPVDPKPAAAPRDTPVPGKTPQPAAVPGKMPERAAGPKAPPVPRRHAARRREEVPVQLPITLGQFVKAAGLAATGGDAKQMVVSGLVSVNGEVDTRRGHKLAFGDVVRVDDAEAVVTAREG